MDAIPRTPDDMLDEQEEPMDDGEDWTCPGCGQENPPVTEHTTRGFTGAPCYITTFECCGHVEADMSQDNLGWVR